MADFRSSLEGIYQDSSLREEVPRWLGLDPPSGGGAPEAVDLPARSGLSQGQVEAIVRRFGRPVLTLWNGTWDPPRSEVWKQRLEDDRQALESAIPSVGRVEVRDFGVTHLGTAWMVSDDVAVTNRHVAMLFAHRGLGAYPFKRLQSGGEVTVRVDFLAEKDNPRSRERRVKEVLFIAEPGEPDIAFLRLDPGDEGLPPPLRLHERRLSRGQRIAVIGYPAYDDRNSAGDQQRIFGGVYDVKRLAPGEVMQVLTGTQFTHDATTLGGNSGSCVVDMKSGEVVGLHFSGKEGLANWAVTAAELRHYVDRYVHGDGASQPSVTQPMVWADEAQRLEWVEDLSQCQGHQASFLGSDDLRVELPELLGEDVALPLEVTGSGDSAATGGSAGSGDTQSGGSQSGNGDTQTGNGGGGDAADEGNPPTELRYTHFSCVMHRERKLALYTVVDIDGEQLHRIKRGSDPWRLDPRIPAEQQWDNELYKSNPLDRGHLVRRLDPVWGDEAERAERETFFWTNCAPQHLSLNRRNWVHLEDYILDSSETHGFKAVIFSGPVFQDDDPAYRGTQLPQAFWKVAVMPVERDGELRLWATAYLLSQASLIEGLEFAFGEFGTFQVPVSKVRRLTFLDFRPLEAFDPLAESEAPPFQPVSGPADIRF